MNMQAYSEAWFLQERFKKFWAYYYSFMPNYNYANRIAVEDGKQMGFHLSNYAPRNISFESRPLAYNTRSQNKRSLDRNRRRRRKKKKCSRKISFCESFSISEDSDTDSDISIDMEYLSFYKKTVEHQAEWRLRKKNKNRIAQEQSSDEVDVQLKMEHPDVARSREMKILYGERASRIHAMETAMQLSFDRINMLQRPAVWPNIPLKLMF